MYRRKVYEMMQAVSDRASSIPMVMALVLVKHHHTLPVTRAYTV